jgi:hypothetical protein
MYDRVLSNSNLLDGCDISRNADKPTQLKITEGEAQLQDDVWKITKKLVVELI